MQEDLERVFPWRLIQHPGQIYAKAGTNLAADVLFHHGKLYDLMRILEVARTLYPSDIYVTWFKMLKVVVPV